MQIANFYLWILRWFTVSFSCFWVPFDFLLINETHTRLCTFTLTSVSGKLFYVASSCYLKCPCHPMFIPQSCISNIFFRDIWLKLWLNFRRSSSHSSAAKGRQEKWSWVWRLELCRRDCPFLCKKSFKSRFRTMERFHHENGEQRLETHRQE